MSVKANYEKPSIQRDGVKPRGVLVVPTVVAIAPNVLLVANVNSAANYNIGANWSYHK